MCLERRDGQDIVPATFGTTEDREVFEHIHLAQRQGRRHGPRGGLPDRPVRHVSLGCSVDGSRSFRRGRAKDDRRHSDIMGKPARRAGQASWLSP